MAQPSPFSNAPSVNDIAAKRKLAMALQGQAIDTSPVGHWTQALARAVQGGVGAYQAGQASQGEKSRKDALAQALAGSGTFGGLSEGDRAIMTQNEDVMKSVAAKAFGNKLDPMAGTARETASLRLQALREEMALNREMAPLKRRQIEATIRQLEQKDVLNSSIAEMLKPQTAAPQGQPPQNGFQPQSFNDPGQDTDPMLVQTQAGGGAPQPQAQPAPSMVNTPFGPRTEADARRMGFGLALAGKGDAGKMLVEAADAQKLGKAGMNKVDEEIIAKISDVAELDNIKNQYKPEFLELGGRLKAMGTSWRAYFNSKSVKPEDRKFLTEYSRFAAASQERMNTRIKAMSGSAVSGHEEVRLNKANPTVSDDPITYESKLNEQITLQRAAVSRYMWLKNVRGLNHDQIANLARSGKIQSLAELDDMGAVIRERGAAIEQQLQGRVPADRMKTEIRKQLKQEFGI